VNIADCDLKFKAHLDFRGVPRRPVQRADVVRMARSYIGTPFHHLGRVKGPNGGIDCGGHLICTGRELGVVAPDFDVPAYSRDPDGQLLPWCRRFMTERSFGELAPGMAVCIQYGDQPRHLGITGNYWHGEGVLSLIHAMHQAEVARPRHEMACVKEVRLMWHERMRFVAAFDFPGVGP
jgi:hypothetical protein